MANTVQVIQDGARNAIIKITIAAANAAAQVVTEQNLTGAVAGVVRKFAITRIQWGLTGAIATLSWDATADVVIADLPVGWGEISLPDGAGIPNNGGAGVTGNIQLDNAAGLTTGFIILEIQKQ